MIKIKGLTKTFGEVKAVDNLTFQIGEGVYGLIGQNGAGKSTLLRLISGVLYQDDGEILVDEHPSNSKEAKGTLFFLPDDPYVPNKCNIEGAYAFYDAYYDIDREHFDKLIATFELPLNKRVATFSKGMRRQLFLAISFSINCDNLLLDEAFDGLDPLVLEVVREEILQKRATGKTVLISSHNLSSLEKIADRFIILYKGQLSKEGESEDIGEEMVKYQAIFKTEVKASDLEKLGYYVISLKKVGSITNFVLKGDKDPQEIIDKFAPVLFENIPLDPEEILALEMALAKKEGK